jgi:uncharacterized DUF497 family protein
VRYVWDPLKAARNLRKHGVSFEEAAEALEDPHAIEALDLDQDEPRLRVLAWSPRGRVLFVVLVERDAETLRIISARKASRTEVKHYEQA